SHPRAGRSERGDPVLSPRAPGRKGRRAPLHRGGLRGRVAAGTLVWVGLCWWAASVLVHWASAALARAPRPTGLARCRPADFTVVAPMNGAPDASAEFVAALRGLADAGVEVLICVADESDGAAAATRALWSDAPILIGSDTTFNPKMNNVSKGLEA